MPTLEYPEQDYYPRSKLRLIIRFEEYNRPILVKKIPSRTTKNLDGILDPRNNLTVKKDPDAPAGIQRFQLTRNDKGNVGSGASQDISSDGMTHVLAGIVPKGLDWNVNGIRHADTLTATIKYIDAPLDPRTIRSCAIEAFMGTVSAEEYAAGIKGLTRGDVFGSGVPNAAEPMDMLADTYLDGNGKQRTNLRFRGWVDMWGIEWDDKAEPIIHLECRDNTSMLIEQEQPSRLVLSMTAPIDKAITDYLSHFPQLQGLSVEYRPATDKIPVLKEVLSDAATRPNLGPPVSKGAGGTEKHSVWDYLTDICGAIGHAVYLDGTVLVIQRVRSLYSSQQINRSDDPFQGRKAGGVEWNFRRFIFGRNVLKMRAKRNFSKRSTTNIEVRCYSPETKNVLVARFPLPADRQIYAIPGDAQPDQKWTVVKVSGIKDPATLRALAQDYYEQIGRSELETEITLKNMASFGGGNLDPDILDMRSGDTVEILTNRDEVYNTLTQMEKQLSAQERSAQFMQVLGFDKDFAETYARVYTDAGFQSTFKARTFKVHWGTNEGMSITLNCVNYVEIRADKFLPNGEEPNLTKGAPKASTTSGPKAPPPPDNKAPEQPDFSGTGQRHDDRLTAYTDQQLHDLHAAGYTDDQIAKLTGKT